MHKKLIVSIFAAVLLLLLAVFAFAAEEWVPANKVPSPFTGREYTREHWTRFSLNEHYNPYKPGTFQDTHSRRIGNAYCSVFDLPNNLTEGYTAVTKFDRERSFNNNGEIAQERKTNISDLEGEYLRAYQFEYKDGACIVSPAWYNNMNYAKLWLYLDKCGCQSDVPIQRKHCSELNYCNDIPDNRHVDDPVCLKKNTPPTDIAGGYDGDRRQKRVWYSKNSKYGSVNLTKKCAVAMYTHQGGMTSADVMVAFPYGLSMVSLEWVSGRNYKATIFNTTPYIAKNVKFRAYVLVNEQMLKIDEKTRRYSSHFKR